MKISNHDLASQIEANLRRQSVMGQAAMKVSSRLYNIEEKLMKAISNPNNAAADSNGNGKNNVTGEKALQVLQLQYDQVKRTFEMLAKLIERKHDMLMRLINRIGGR